MLFTDLCLKSPYGILLGNPFLQIRMPSRTPLHLSWCRTSLWSIRPVTEQHGDTLIALALLSALFYSMFYELPGVFVSLGMMQRTKWGWVVRKLDINLFRFSCKTDIISNLYIISVLKVIWLCWKVKNSELYPYSSTEYSTILCRHQQSKLLLLKNFPSVLKWKCGCGARCESLCQRTYPKEYRDSLEGRALLLGSFLLPTIFSWKMRWQSSWGTAADPFDSLTIVHLTHSTQALTQHWSMSGERYSRKSQTGNIILGAYLHLQKQNWHKDGIKFS